MSGRRIAAAAGALAVAAGGIAGGLLATQSSGFDIMAAYTTATDGATITVQAGSYPELDLYGCSEKHVVFQGAGADQTKLARLDDGCASNVTFRDMTIGVALLENANKPVGTPHDITLERVNGALFYVQGPVANVTIRDGTWGPAMNAHPAVSSYNPGDPGPTNVLISGNVFHDFKRNGPDVHTECLQLRQGRNVSVIGNKMWNCDGTGTFAIGDGPHTNLLIQGNHFGLGGDNGYSAQITTNVNGMTWRGNTATGAVFWGNTGNPTGVLFDSNLMPWSYGLCDHGTFTNNRMTGGKCSASDVQVASLNTVNLTDNLDQIGGSPPPPPTTTDAPSPPPPPTTTEASPQPPPPPVTDPRIIAARKHLNAQATLWRSQGRTWAWIKTQPAWLALKDLA